MENQSLSKKPLFNLSRVLQETGIKADTLRAWERRYQLPSPSRTEGGHRLFSAYDIETIKWLQARQDEGMRISQAVDYWQELIGAGADPLASQIQQAPAATVTPTVDQRRQPLESLTRLWIDHALKFDEENAEKALDAAFAQFPWEVVGTELIFKGLTEIGDRWYSGEISVQQEHFASELVIRKIQSLTAAAPAPVHPQKVLISCPPREHHTIAPLVINMLLRYRGWDVTYLGGNVPDEQLQDALDKVQPSLAVLTAARLSTSAALLETSRILQAQGIPLAYGGNVFTYIPQLAERIPGTYLGTDLSQAVNRIETLLSAPEPPAPEPLPSNPHLALLKELQDKLPFLENQALLAIAEDSRGDFPHAVIQDANNFLFQDILAALSLGDIRLLRYNIEWVEGLMKTRKYDLSYFKRYIRSFISVSRENLSKQAEPLLAWLEEFQQELL